MNKRLLYAIYTVLLVAIAVGSVVVHVTIPTAVVPYAIGVGLGFLAGGLTAILAYADPPQ